MNRILLVDDDSDMMMRCGNWLKKAGYEVFKATSGQEALDLLGTTEVDLIILDYAMPGMDGPATFEAIKNMDTAKNTPVLFRTGMDDAAASDIMNALNPAGVIPKSEGKTALLKAVADHM